MSRFAHAKMGRSIVQTDCELNHYKVEFHRPILKSNGWRASTYQTGDVEWLEKLHKRNPWVVTKIAE